MPRIHQLQNQTEYTLNHSQNHEYEGAIRHEKAAHEPWALRKLRAAATRGGADCRKGMTAGLGMTKGRKSAGSWSHSAVPREQMRLAVTVHGPRFAACEVHSRR